MLKHLALTATALAAISAPALADVSFKNSDYCAYITGRTYPIADCLRDEREARRSVRTTSARISTLCAQIADAVGGSYQFYNVCVEQEEQARSQASPPMDQRQPVEVSQMRKHRTLTATLSASARADVYFDSAAHCAHIADVVGGSYQIEEVCLRQESDARRNMRVTSDRIAAHCANVTNSVDAGYHFYNVCVEQEEQARSRMLSR